MLHKATFSLQPDLWVNFKEFIVLLQRHIKKLNNLLERNKNQFYTQNNTCYSIAGYQNKY
jgi:hypothetical protein